MQKWRSIVKTQGENVPRTFLKVITPRCATFQFSGMKIHQNFSIPKHLSTMKCCLTFGACQMVCLWVAATKNGITGWTGVCNRNVNVALRVCMLPNMPNILKLVAKLPRKDLDSYFEAYSVEVCFSC